MRPRPELFLALAFLASLPACKKDKPQPSSDFDARAFCKSTMEGGRSLCKDATGDGIKVSMCVSTLRSALDHGARIDSAAASKCAFEAESKRAKLPDHRSLSDLVGPIPSCANIVSGALAEGEDCISTMECKDGMVCANMKCANRGKEGEKCGPLLDLGLGNVRSSCAEGLYCDGDHACRTPAAEGGACHLSEGCAKGLRCVDGKCAKSAGAETGPGAACEDTADCANGLYCPLGGGECTKRKAKGESCFLDDECLGYCDSKDNESVCVGPCGG
jgi:hypothetical protein